MMRDAEHRLAIVLPAYNESQTLADTMRAFQAQEPEAFFVVVDNNSADDTAAIARRTLEELGARGCVVAERRQGKGWAVRAGFAAADAQAYVLCDADCTYPADAVGVLVKPIFDGEADMVVGNRHALGAYAQENKRALNSMGNWLVPRLINRLFAANLGDNFSGYRAFSREFVANFPILSSGFEIETEMSLHALDKRFRIVELPIAYRERPEGSESKLNALRDGTRVLATVFQILRYYRPLYLFGSLAVFFAAGGLAVGAVPVYQFVTTGFILSVPAAVLAASMEVIALMLASIGLVNDALVRQHRFDFEMALARWRRERRAAERNAT
jgi:glycosyltransferase involved in cell wall biosynthesis